MEAMRELVVFLAKALVDDPDAVEVKVVEEDRAYVFELSVAQGDLGKVIGRNGRTAQVGPGDVVGELGLLLDRARNATVRARTPLECLALGRDDLKAAVMASPELGWTLLCTVAERLDG